MVGLRDHVVDFYEQEAELAERVAEYLADGLRRGEAAIVIATREHRALFARSLGTRGIDVAWCRSNGLLSERGAEALLGSFFIDGTLHPWRFDATVGQLVRSARRPAGTRVVGEMVDLLWAKGDAPGAFLLESIWDELVESYNVMLYCCNRASSMEGDARAFERTGDLHSRVVSAPAAIGWVGFRGTESFPPGPTSPRAVRLFTADLLKRWGLGSQIDVVSIIVSELTTNAVVHAGTPFQVVLSRRKNGLRIAVHDSSGALPVLAQPEATATSGRGMGIVAALSSDWGIDQGPAGKTVWADLAVQQHLPAQDPY